MKTIDYRDWVKATGTTKKNTKRILAKFDVGELKRGRRAPARARRVASRRRRTRAKR